MRDSQALKLRVLDSASILDPALAPRLARQLRLDFAAGAVVQSAIEEKTLLRHWPSLQSEQTLRNTLEGAHRIWVDSETKVT